MSFVYTVMSGILIANTDPAFPTRLLSTDPNQELWREDEAKKSESICHDWIHYFQCGYRGMRLARRIYK